MTRIIKYPHVIKDLDKIIQRLLTEEVSKADIAAECNVSRSAIEWAVKKRATVSQLETIAKKGLKVAVIKRRRRAVLSTGESKVCCKVTRFEGIYSDPLSPVKHRIVRPESITKKGSTFKVQSKLDDGIWYDVDIPAREDDAITLLGRLFGYDLTDQGLCIDPLSV